MEIVDPRNDQAMRARHAEPKARAGEVLDQAATLAIALAIGSALGIALRLLDWHKWAFIYCLLATADACVAAIRLESIKRWRNRQYDQLVKAGAIVIVPPVIEAAFDVAVEQYELGASAKEVMQSHFTEVRDVIGYAAEHDEYSDDPEVQELTERAIQLRVNQVCADIKAVQAARIQDVKDRLRADIAALEVGDDKSQQLADPGT